MHFPGLSCSGSWVLHTGTDPAGHVFCALPRPEQLRRPGAWRSHCPRWAVHLIHLPGSGCSVSQVFNKSTVLGVPCVSGELISGCDPTGSVNCPGSQEDVISNSEPAHSLVEDAISGAEIAAASCLPALAVACLPVCLQQGGVYMQPVLLWYSSILCSVSAPGCMLEPFTGKFFFFLIPFLSLEIPRFGLLSHVSSLILFSGHSRHSRPYPKVWWCSLNLPAQPPLAGSGRELLGYFSIGSWG